jgi:hypothetical protein
MANDEQDQDDHDDRPLLFGPIEDEQGRISALVVKGKLSAAQDVFVREHMGDPSLDSGNIQVWRLAKPSSYIKDNWRWLHNGLTWKAEQLGLELQFTDWIGEIDNKGVIAGLTGPLFDEKESDELISAYKRSKIEAEAKPTQKEITGFQRLLNKAWALRDPNLKPVDRLTLFAILHYCWSKDYCTEWEQTIADDVGCSVRHLQRSLNTLVKYGYIRVEHRHRHKSVYRVLRKDLIPPYPNKKSGG